MLVCSVRRHVSACDSSDSHKVLGSVAKEKRRWGRRERSQKEKRLEREGNGVTVGGGTRMGHSLIPRIPDMIGSPCWSHVLYFNRASVGHYVSC